MVSKFVQKGEMDGHGAGDFGGDQSYDASSMLGRLNREDEYESRSGSDNNIFEGNGSGDDQPDADEAQQQQPHKKKKYHRHNQFQIVELEKAFKECPHPDEKQRLDLGRMLGLESRQIKFWFQNRRTQLKTQLERHDNVMMRQENDKLKAENEVLRQGLGDPICNKCGGSVVPGPISFDQQQLRLENARLRDELVRVCSLVNKFLGMPVSSNGYGHMANVDAMGIDFVDPCNNFAGVIPLGRQPSIDEVTSTIDKSMFADYAMTALNELYNMAQAEEPLWVTCPELGGDREMLNLDEYARIALPTLGLKRSGFAYEASREIGSVMMNSFALVEMLMNVDQWAETFAGLVAGSHILEVITHGLNGTKDGTLQLMEADVQVISPLVPARREKFLRFCKQRNDGVWAVVDFSIGISPEGSSSFSFPTSMKLPSGCIIQDMNNGCSKVTWVEHSEYDETSIHQMLRPLIRTGRGFGARRWLSTLQRYYECVNIFMSPSPVSEGPSDVTVVAGKKSMLRLAHRMVENFCSGVVSGDSIGAHKWERMTADDVSPDVKLLTRKSFCEPGEPSGVVLAVSTSVWLPVSRQRVFDYLSNIQTRKDWDILTNGGLMREMYRIPKGRAASNCISLFQSAVDPNTVPGGVKQNFIVQEAWHDASMSLIVYAPVELPMMEVVLNGGDETFARVLPNGFAIFPDGRDQHQQNIVMANAENGGAVVEAGVGSILTVGFQILVNTRPGGKLSVESVETMNKLLSRTLQQIKGPLQAMATS
ncbi:Homeobox-leucine zipper protein ANTHOCYANINLESS 2 [Linum grandiflorum]